MDFSKKSQNSENGKLALDLTDFGGGDGGIDNPCFGHGSVVSYGGGWDIATCKSGCERGIGFRCGRYHTVTCSDGTVVTLSNTGSTCPSTVANRHMNGVYTFYDDGTMKITFLNAVPSEENGNTDFEIEGDDSIVIPPYLSIGGEFYSAFRINSGIYQIDYSDGDFGSVTMPVVLVP
jgi:hypothetical protein